MECLFCKIAERALPAKMIHETDRLFALDDINPQAPQHKIIIPKKHIATLNEVSEQDASLLSEMVQAAIYLANQLKLAQEGYRLVWNCNASGGQTVFHIHLHLLGGRQMVWPPG